MNLIGYVQRMQVEKELFATARSLNSSPANRQ